MTHTHGLPPMAWLHDRHYSRILRTLAAGGEDARRVAAPYADALSTMIIPQAIADRRVLAKNIVTVEIVRERGEAAANTDTVRAELRLVQPLHAFLEAGRQVFEFTEDLVRELARTDVNDVHPSDIQVPYDAFYLRLASGLPDSDGNPIDGILIQHRDYSDMGRSLVLDFLPPYVDQSGFDAAMVHMPIAVVPLAGEDALGAEIDVANWKIASPTFLTEGAKNMGMDRSGQNWYDKTVDMTRRRYEIGLRYVQANLPLIANALLFIDNCHDEQRIGWSADAPADLVAKAQNAGTGSAKAEQKLVREGWTKVTLCQTGREVTDHNHEETERTVRAHWRRGHWRRQATGPGRSRVTLVRVRPTMVGAGSAPAGRTYQARATSDRLTPTHERTGDPKIPVARSKDEVDVRHAT